MNWHRTTLTDDFEIKGHWFLPGNTDAYYAGVLSRKEMKNSLFLFGSFTSFQDHGKLDRTQQNVKKQILHGYGMDGEKVTLHKCRLTNYQTMIGAERGYESYGPDFVFVGAHFNSPDDIKFTSMSLTAENLELWIGYISVGYEKNVDETDDRSFSIKGREMKDILIDIPSIGKVRIHADIYPKGNGISSIEFVQTGWISFEPDQVQPFSWFLSHMDQVTNLLTLLMGHATYPKCLTFTTEERVFLDNMKTVDNVSVYYEPARRREKVGEAVTYHDFLIPLSPLLSQLDSIFQKWFDGVGKLDEMRGLYFSAVYNRAFSMEYRLLTLVRSLECYSRVMNTPPPKVPKNPNKNPPRTSLDERITALMGTLEDDTITLFTSQPEEFRKTVIDVRDYRTHYIQELKATTLTGNDLYALIAKLNLFVTILLLKEVGIAEKEIQAIIRNSQVWIQRRYLYFDSGS